MSTLESYFVFYYSNKRSYDAHRYVREIIFDNFHFDVESTLGRVVLKDQDFSHLFVALCWQDLMKYLFSRKCDFHWSDWCYVTLSLSSTAEGDVMARQRIKTADDSRVKRTVRIVWWMFSYKSELLTDAVVVTSYVATPRDYDDGD